MNRIGEIIFSGLVFAFAVVSLILFVLSEVIT